MPLPNIGAVLGVDVGYSPTKRSSAICRLDWSESDLSFTVDRFRAVEPDRTDVIRALCDRDVQAAAFDGPLRRGLDDIGVYRMAEQVLTRGFHAIGKPGQSSSRNGKCLNAAANICANIVIHSRRVSVATHTVPIHELAIVEAFPTTFLGVMIDHPQDAVGGRHRSDRYYKYLTANGRLTALLEYLIPGRVFQQPFVGFTNHDDRAAVVCALTALCVAANEYTAVGDDNGWIILPPSTFVEAWAWEVLNKNTADDQSVFVRSRG